MSDICGTVRAGTSVIHAETFSRGLGWDVVDVPSGPRCLWVGISPQLKEEVEAYDGFKIFYWIGSDSLCALQDPAYRANIPKADLHIAVHERIAEELSLWKVDAKVVYPCSRYTGGNQEIKHERVGIYSPSPYHPNDLYKFKECIEIAKQVPAREFVFYGQQESLVDVPSNCIDFGRKETDQIGSVYEEFSVMLRLCKHDGNPVGGIEALQRGLNVIEDYPYKGFLCPLKKHLTKQGEVFGVGLDDVVNLLKNDGIYDGNHGPWPAWYRENCSPKAFGENVKKLLR